MSLHDISWDRILQVASENKVLIKCIKLQVAGSVLENCGLDAVKLSKKAAVDSGLPLMVHIGIMPDENIPPHSAASLTRDLLPVLDKGDILSHIFTPQYGGVVRDDGTILPELYRAMDRGVLLDIAHGRRNFSFKSAQKCLREGVIPDTISTDLSHFTFPNGIVGSLLVTMSKLIAMGVSVRKAIEMTTINPARALREEHLRGSLRVGMAADICVLEQTSGDFVFSDSTSHTLKGTVLLKLVTVLKAGKQVQR